MKQVKTSYEIGDIVYVSEYKYEDGTPGAGHLFVIIDTTDDIGLMSAESFGFLVSSNIKKSKENSRFKFNEPLNKNKANGLNDNSIVKCDVLYNIPPKNILFKIGSIDADDYIRFTKSYENYLNEKVAQPS